MLVKCLVSLLVAVATSVSTSGTSGAASTAGAFPVDILQAEQVLLRKKDGRVSRVEVVRLNVLIRSSEVERECEWLAVGEAEKERVAQEGLGRRSFKSDLEGWTRVPGALR
jgi:hypothetical protein